MKKRQEKEQMIIDRDGEIDDCKRKIDEMSSEFAAMLKTKLIELQERIEFAGKSYEHEGNEISMLKKLDDIAANTRWRWNGSDDL